MEQTPATFQLRRDFADELGFGEFLLVSLEPALISRGRTTVNRELGLSPALPRFVGYYTRGGCACITGDGDLVYTMPANGLFQEMLGKLAAGIAADPKLRKAEERTGQSMTLEMSDDGGPNYFVLHDTHTSCAWLWIANEESHAFLKTQP